MKPKQKEPDVEPIYSHNPYDATSFPLLVLDVQHRICVPPNEGFQMLHWHEELQFVFVLSGTVHVTVYDEAYVLNTGDCIFLNRTVLHHIVAVADTHYHSFLIPTRMLTFFAGSAMEQKDVQPITGNPSFTCFHLKQSIPEYADFFQNLLELDSLYFHTGAKENSRYEYRLSIALAQLWLSFILLLPKSSTCVPSKNYERIRLLLSFIHQNYQKQLSADEIAAAAHISKRECLRCFQKFVHESPYRYLLRYRLHISTTLLTTTDFSVTDIALEVGFHSASSYIRYFKERYHMTPYQYRKNAAMHTGTQQ